MPFLCKFMLVEFDKMQIPDERKFALHQMIDCFRVYDLFSVCLATTGVCVFVR